MARMLTANNPDLYAPGLRKVYLSAVDDVPREFRQFLNITTGPNPGGQAGRHYFDDVQVASFGGFIDKPEGEPIQYDRIQEVGTVRYTPFTFGLGARATMEAIDDELYGVMAKLARELGGAGAYTQEIQGFRPLNSGFGTTGGTGFTAAGFDSTALFSTAHPLKRGGTNANRATTDMDLSVTALEIAQNLLQTTLSESGTPTPRTGEVLIGGPQLYYTMKELTSSELKPYTANNEINPVYGEMSFIQVHYLTDVDSWFLFARKDKHDVNAWIRREIDVEFDSDFDTGDLKMKGVFRLATGHGDWRGTFGSQGA